MDLQPTGVLVLYSFITPTIRLVVDLFTQFPRTHSRRCINRYAKNHVLRMPSEELETYPQFIGVCFVKAFVGNARGCQRKEPTTTLKYIESE